jgi:hypothetical protein
MAKKLRKSTIIKGHRIAKAILRKKGARSKSSAYAIGMAAAKKGARKKKRKR